MSHNSELAALGGVTAHDVQTVENYVIEGIEREAVRAAANERNNRLAELDSEIHALRLLIVKAEQELTKHSEVWKEHASKTRELTLLRKKIASVEKKRSNFEEASRAREILKAIPTYSDHLHASNEAKEHDSEESKRDYLIRTGRITPFQSSISDERTLKRRRSTGLQHDSEQGSGKILRVIGASSVKSISIKEEGPASDKPYNPLHNVEVDEENEGNAENTSVVGLAEVDTELFPGSEEEIILDGRLKIPASIYDNLFDYQKTGVQWLWELHNQECGGIIGDEMGLGKTVQIIAFLAALQYSGELDGPVIVVAPTTVLQQWKREFGKWGHAFTTHVLHHSDSKSQLNGSGNGVKTWSPVRVIKSALNGKDGVLITSYEQVRKHHRSLLGAFEYVILDEGHKIRNPNAAITLVCKQFDTAHRIIMSGSPLQNNLKELWSLFDFVFPGRLGTLPVFEEQFSVPIAVGGYTSASKSQVYTAYKCAVVLRDLISPYLLRRMKKDVAVQLPKKSEQVLFCRLTTEQRTAYEEYVASRVVRDVLNGRMNLLAAISVLRKICNHPDIAAGCRLGRVSTSVCGEQEEIDSDYGNWKRSGKLQLLNNILPIWHRSKSRVLIFSQARTMLDVIELFVKARRYCYRRMDGETPIGQRMKLIDEFNQDTDIFLFLLTTKVGGLGVNLTGADRVVIIDPDWNPATDLQARERAWRIGQKRPVTIYRLITSGTIEEKMYHRQIYKQFLSNKVLSDPRQRRFFKPKQLRDLFALGAENDVGTETGDLFAGTSAKEKLMPHTTLANGSKLETAEGHGSVSENSCIDDGPAGEDVDTAGDAGMLKDLFNNPDGSGLQSAMDHDEIVNAATKGVDLKLMDSEAERVASKAAEELSRSRDQRLRQGGVAIPTWTGRAGTAGIPRLTGSRIGGPQSSRVSSLLNRIKEREEGGAKLPEPGRSRVHSDPSLRNGSSSDTRAEIMGSIVQLLKNTNGQATTATVVENFRDRVGTSPKDLALFKAMLKKVAALRKASRPGGTSTWTLRSLYRE